MEKGKVIIFSAPSGSGKSTLINYLMTQFDCLEFSISATSRSPRGEEKNGVEYYFLTPEEFRAKISEHAFLEWEEVYENKYYGTLRSEVERINTKGNIVVFDVDVAGGCNIKKMFGSNALSIFIMPPSVATLKERLVKRGTDAMEVIEDRVNKASYEMTFSNRFDRIVVNDDLECTKALIRKIVREFVDNE
ncbi:MAG: guanylate kinase [Paludibacteraceae bacterium]|nr:guanylate kinase [Paludibacteraceae bacterium]